MVGSISFDGVVSGMKTGDMITKLMDIEKAPLTNLQYSKAIKANQINVWKEITASLLSFKIDAYVLSRDTLFNTKKASSSDTAVLDASVTGSPAEGTYSFIVNKLAQAHQMVSNGYEDEDATKVGAGTISFEFGAGNVNPRTKLDFLNGQAGVSRGSIKITDRNGDTATIDLSKVTEVQEVISAINNSDSIDITASVNAYGNGINLVGNSGIGNIKVEEVNGGSTAESLGIKETTGAAQISGDSIYYVASSTRLNLLNDGNGVRTVSGNDMRITLTDGTTNVDIDLSSATRMSDVIAAINDADVRLTASLVDDGNGNKVLQVVDSQDDGTALAITALNSSKAVSDLGLDNLDLTGNTTALGQRIIGGIDTVMIRNLRGGSGIDLTNDIVLNLRNGNTYTVEAAGFSGAATLKEFVDAFNNDADAGGRFSAQINEAGNGIEVVDLSTPVGVNVFSVDSNGTTDSTTGFNIAYTHTDPEQDTINGRDLDFKYLSENTKLTDLNSGAGVHKGKIKFTNRNGNSITLDFNADYIKTLGDVINKINTDAAGFSITASINSTGDGILIHDGSLGTNNLKIENYGGSFADDLNIAKDVAGATIDGSYEQAISITATDTLENVRDKINDANLDVRAAIINDGSVSGGYKLMLTSKNTGEAGQLIIDSNLAGGEGLLLSTVSMAQNAVFTLGTQGASAAPAVIYKSSNTVSDVIAGVSMQLKSVDTDPVVLTLTNNYDSITESIESFVASYNRFIDLVNTRTSYDPETNTAGELQGDYTVNQMKNEVFSSLTEAVDGLPNSMNNIMQVGLGFDLTGKLSLNKADLSEALQSNLDGVRNLFTYTLNIGSSANGGTAQSSGFDAPYTDAGAIDGNTSYTDFENGTTGWMEAGGNSTYYQINFDGNHTLEKFILDSMDTSAYPAASYAIKSFDLDYWDLIAAEWKTYKSYTSNSSGSIIGYFSTPITTDKIRINKATGNDGFSRIAELEVYEAKGVAKRLDAIISNFTNTTDGMIAGKTDSINEEIDVIDQQMTTMQARLDWKEENYRVQFQKMEKALQQFQSTSSWLSTQLTNISNNQG